MASFQFSSKYRQNILETMADEQHDVLIIGGGITGAGIALDAVTRGMKVALVDMQDFAAGTSSRSTKLVHGGLRYLKNFEFTIVKETGRERAIVYENGPHVTTPEWMLLPFYKDGTFGYFTTSIGLWMYDHLAGVKREERRAMLSVEETLKKEPLLKRDGLLGGGYYVEYKTDDARLTIEVLKKAVEKGALAINYTKAIAFIYDENRKIIGAKVRDVFTDKEYDIVAHKVVNATGPWVEEVRDLDYSTYNKRLQLTKGIHLVFDQSVFPLRQAVYFDTPDGRMVFAIPRSGKTYVGTTDTVYTEDKAHPKMTVADRDYLLQAIHYIFPDVKITKEDVESSWAGIRPLIYEAGKDPSEISRKDEIWVGESGLINIAGGKLTGYRKMAEDVVDLIAQQFQGESNRAFQACQTKHLPISGGDIGGSKNLQNFIDEKSREATQYGLTEEEGRHLARKYGANVEQLFLYANEARVENHYLPPFVYAQYKYALEEEMIAKPVDFFIRRTGALFFAIEWVRQWKEPIIEQMAKDLGWTEEIKDAYMQELEKELQDATTPIDEGVLV